ncbi:MAG: RICIN domain-containing protein, partial [Muribaculaceae bacterium]|nr:RICIN domain-containing protein [Muribaculaceae bacterium]
GNDRLTFNLPPKSVATMVIPVSVDEQSTDLIAAGRSYFICPRNTEEVALSAAGGRVMVDKLNFTDSQIWTLGAAADGTYTFTNAAGVRIAANGDEYALVATDADATAFAVTPLDAPYYKITTSDAAKAFDLEGESYDAGTGVGLWLYDGDAPVHRQWLFAPVPDGFESGIAVVEGGASDRLSPVAVSVPESGVLLIRSLIEEPQTVSVYNAAGICIYRTSLAEGEIRIPLAAGYYVAGSDKGAAKAVVVR